MQARAAGRPRDLPMKLFLLQLRGELRKLFGRKRTYIGFGAFLLIEILILILLQLPKVQRSFRHMIERSGYIFEDYFSGTTLAFEILRWTIFSSARFILRWWPAMSFRRKSRKGRCG
jgi:hypothetical protein